MPAKEGRPPIGPDDPNEAFRIALGHHQAGRLAEAEAIYRSILSRVPDHVDSLHLSGVIANQSGRHAEAIALIEKAIRQRSHKPVAEFHNNIGVAFRASGQAEVALEHFKRALTLKPEYSEAHLNFGALLAEIGRLQEAEAPARRAVALNPGSSNAHYNLGNILQRQRKFDEAIGSYRSALELRPNYAEAHNNLGTSLKDLGRFDEAIPHYHRALAMKPDSMSARYNLGLVLEEQGKLDEALECYVQAQALAPDYADAHWNEALLRLLRGEFTVGWRKFEWRQKRKETPVRAFSQPRWSGEDLNGRTILLHAEQGYGDTIQFVRYAQSVKERGAKVLMLCQSGLERLLETAPGIDTVIADGAAIPPFDCHAALLSLPFLLETTADTIPKNVPYLFADPDLKAAWLARGVRGPRLKIGLVWHGNPANTIHRKKSIPVESMALLCEIPGIDWFSLQTDATTAEMEILSRHGAIRDCGGSLTDWADTAALIDALDLVIAMDTGVAHLAGAMGKPGWVLLSHIPDWRWRLAGEESAWYPTLRLFRQTAPGDWPGLLRRVSNELEKLRDRRG